MVGIRDYIVHGKDDLIIQTVTTWLPNAMYSLKINARIVCIESIDF